ncbi:MAG: hypothetical protein WC862_04730 [Patescibacteria group bacterium]
MARPDQPPLPPPESIIKENEPPELEKLIQKVGDLTLPHSERDKAFHYIFLMLKSSLVSILDKQERLTKWRGLVGPTDWEDISQMVLEKLWKSATKKKLFVTNINGWLQRVTDRCTVDFMRARDHRKTEKNDGKTRNLFRPPLQLTDPHDLQTLLPDSGPLSQNDACQFPSPEIILARAEMRLLLERAIQQIFGTKEGGLSKMGEAIRLYYLENMPPELIAKELKTTVNSIRVGIQHAKNKLRKYLVKILPELADDPLLMP